MHIYFNRIRVAETWRPRTLVPFRPSSADWRDNSICKTEWAIQKLIKAPMELTDMAQYSQTFWPTAEGGTRPLVDRHETLKHRAEVSS